MHTQYTRRACRRLPTLSPRSVGGPRWCFWTVYGPSRLPDAVGETPNHFFYIFGGSSVKGSRSRKKHSESVNIDLSLQPDAAELESASKKQPPGVASMPPSVREALLVILMALGRGEKRLLVPTVR